MKYSISAALVALSRKVSYFFPRVTAVGGDDMEAVRRRCRDSYSRSGHCETPYPVGDVRRWVWIEESCKFIPPASPRAIEGEFIVLPEVKGYV
jgi:hypothetical protein